MKKNKGGAITWALLLLLTLIVIFLIVYAYYAKIDVIVVGSGKIETFSRTQTIQNLEGGIVKAIFVKDGDFVKKGQIVVKLDDTRFQAAYRKDLEKYISLQAKIHMLKAETLNAKELTYSKEFTEQYPKIVTASQQAFNSRKKALNDSISMLQKNYQYAENELKMISPLVKEGILSKLEAMRLKDKLVTIQGQIHEKVNQYQSNAHNELLGVESEFRSIDAILKNTKDQIARTTIRSPMTGYVKKVFITTIGEVIQPGNKIIEIVPKEDNLITVVRVKPKDIRYVKVGQKAVVIISGYDFSKYGGLAAKVVNVGADSINEDNVIFFEVRLKSDRTYLGTEQQRLPLKPGMTVTAKIKTGTKTIFDFLFRPFLLQNQAIFYRS